MSARVLNPPMFMSTEMSRGLTGGGRVIPTKEQLAPVRRDLFGPVDHAAARALAERELRAQSSLDAERWGFDFQSGVPQRASRYAWEVVAPTDIVPEPYALRGMPYLRKHAPGTPRKTSTINGTINSQSNSPTKSSKSSSSSSSSSPSSTSSPLSPTSSVFTGNNSSSISNSTSILTTSTSTSTSTTKKSASLESESRIYDLAISPGKAEMTPPQELRVPDIRNRNGETTPEDPPRDILSGKIIKRSIEDPTTPVLPHAARKQSTITDFMKSRKRTLKDSSKSIVEPPEKISRNAGQIRS